RYHHCPDPSDLPRNTRPAAVADLDPEVFVPDQVYFPLNGSSNPYAQPAPVRQAHKVGLLDTRAFRMLVEQGSDSDPFVLALQEVKPDLVGRAVGLLHQTTASKKESPRP